MFRDDAPLAAQRTYTPRIVTLADWLDYATLAGIAGGVLVQPSVYGFDNSVMLEAIASAPERLRGIAVIEPTTNQIELARLNAGGVRGVRCNTRNLGGLGFDLAVGLAGRIAPLGWTLQFQVRPDQLDTLAEIAPSLALPIVLDHFGFIDTDANALPRLRRLLDTGVCYVKLSAPYRLGQTYSAAAMTELVNGLVASHPERLLWGSDWPHTELWDAMPDDAELIDELVAQLDENVRRIIFVDTPNSLFFSN